MSRSPVGRRAWVLAVLGALAALPAWADGPAQRGTASVRTAESSVRQPAPSAERRAEPGRPDGARGPMLGTGAGGPLAAGNPIVQSTPILARALPLDNCSPSRAAVIAGR